MPPDDFFPKLRKFLDERNILLFADEVLTSMGRTGKYLCMEHWNVLPDIVTLGKGFGNGFPVTAMAVRTPYADAVDKISASTSYGGNPMACAAALACFEVIEEEGLLEHAQHLEVLFKKRMADWTSKYRIVGDTRCKGCLLGIELVKDKTTKEPFDAAGKMVYQKAFRKGLAWVPRSYPAHEPAYCHAGRGRPQRHGPDRRSNLGNGKRTGLSHSRLSHPKWPVKTLAKPARPSQPN